MPNRRLIEALMLGSVQPGRTGGIVRMPRSGPEPESAFTRTRLPFSPVQHEDPSGNLIGDPRKPATLPSDPLGIQAIAQASREREAADLAGPRIGAAPLTLADPRWDAWLRLFGQMEQNAPVVDKRTRAGARGQEIGIPVAFGDTPTREARLSPADIIYRQAERSSQRSGAVPMSQADIILRKSRRGR